MIEKLSLVDPEKIKEARSRLKNIVNHTVLANNNNLSDLYNCNIYLKREDLQIVRSYKIRGAYNLISSCSPAQLKNGIVCASAGNHAQGVAFSCNLMNIKGTIFMPATTPKQKVTQVKMFGKTFVDIVLTGDTFDDAFLEATQFCEKNQMLFVPPFDHEKIIEGQGTVGVEILEDTKVPIDYILVPVGGGGLVSGIISYFKTYSPHTKIIGVEPAGAPAMAEAIKAGHVVKLEKIDKFVDGAAVKKVGELNYKICQDYLHQVILVPEGKVCSTIIKLYNEEAIVVEPAGALTIAALDYIKTEIVGKNVVCIVSGSNNDLDRLNEIKERSLIYEGLKFYFIISFPQRAGALREFLDEVLGPNDDITHFQYTKKNSKEEGPAMVGIELRNKEDYLPLLDRLNKKGINYTILNDNQNLFNLLV